jgi:hypothetical protein
VTNWNDASVFVLHERSVGKLLAKLGYRRLSVPPRHPLADEEAQEAFKKTSPRRSRRSSLTAPRPADRNLAPGRSAHRSARTGVWARARNAAPRAMRSTLQMGYIFGAVCPQRRVTAALVLPAANTEAMALHLAEIGRQVAPGAQAALIFDGAGYHLAKRPCRSRKHAPNRPIEPSPVKGGRLATISTSRSGSVSAPRYVDDPCPDN